MKPRNAGGLRFAFLVGASLVLAAFTYSAVQAPHGQTTASGVPAVGLCPICNVPSARYSAFHDHVDTLVGPPAPTAAILQAEPVSQTPVFVWLQSGVGHLELAAFSVGLCAVILGWRWGPVFPKARTAGRAVPITMVLLLVVSSGNAIGRGPTAAAAVPVQPVKQVTYQSDFAHGYTRGWYVQPGVNAQSSLGLVSDGGQQVLNAQANGGPAINIMYTEGEDWRNMTVSATVKSVNGSILDLNFRQQFIPANASAYVLRLNLGSGQVSLNRTITEITTAAPVVRTSALGSAAYAASSGRWYQVSVNATGGHLQAAINGSKVIDVVDPQPLLFGTVSFAASQPYAAFRVSSVVATAQISPQGTWQQLGGPDGGQVQAIDIDPSNTSIVYAAAVHSGLWKSDNKGGFWKEVGYTNGVAGTKFNIVAVAPSNSSVLYASIEDSSQGGGASRSNDGGAHWRSLFQGTTGYFLETLAVDPTDPNTVYIGTEQTAGSTVPVGLLKSSNGGLAFSTLFLASVQTIAIARTNPQVIYVGTFDKGLMRSDDGGATWRSLHLPPGAAPVNRVVLDPNNPNIAVAHLGVVNLGGRTCGPLFRTTDGGATWTILAPELQQCQNTSQSNLSSTLDVAIAPSSGNTMYMAGTDSNGYGLVYRSDNSGTTWRLLSAKLASEPQTMKVDPTDPNTLYVGTFNDGVYRTTDGGATFVRVDTGFLGGGIYALALDPRNSNVIWASRGANGQGEVFGTDATLAKSTDGGVTWAEYSGPPSLVVGITIDQTNPNVMYVATAGSSFAKGSGVWKSIDGGNTWAQKNNGLADLNITTIVVSPSDSSTIFAGTGHRPYGGMVGHGIFKSTDAGNSWRKVNFPNLPVNSIVVNPATPSAMYAATFGQGVLKSTDGGENWSQAGTGIASPYVYALAIDPNQPSTLYAGANPFYADPKLPDPHSDVYKTTNAGGSWKAVLQDADIEWIMLDPGSTQGVYVGDHGGYIYSSPDGGTTWVYGTDQLRRIGGHVYMWANVVDTKNRALLVGTCGRGVFINHLSQGEPTTPTWLTIHFGPGTYNAVLSSNSSLSDFSFSQSSRALVFSVTGMTGTTAFTNVTVPTNLMGGPYTVTLDGAPLAPSSVVDVQSRNATQVVVSYVQNGKAQVIQLQASAITAVTTTSTSRTTTLTTTTTTSTSTSTSSVSTTSTTTTTSPTRSTTTATTSTTPEFPPAAPGLILAGVLFLVLLLGIASGRGRGQAKGGGPSLPPSP